ncbi:acylphosphatase [Engelhardtia mirabilis]|uniref:acylphosphatase n=1 Tax=Engelhardtia mirabilis TaxID=2528011 RepID=UPI0011AAFF1D
MVSGRVQGVGFRWSTARAAKGRGVRGWVRNLIDGRVEAHLEGEPQALDSMLAWLAKGPPSARVDALERFDAEPLGAEGFEQRRDGGR